jgi:Kef-type K+ transport system membrane component KefB
LSCAAIDDVLAWCTLALTLSYASGGSPINGLYTALIAIGFVLVLVFVVRRVIAYIHQRLIEQNDEMNKTFIATIFFLLCISSWFAEIAGIHAFFGSFAFGAMVPKVSVSTKTKLNISLEWTVCQ